MSGNSVYRPRGLSVNTLYFGQCYHLIMGGGLLAVGTEGVGVNSRGETDRWKCDG